ncbi:MAG: dihydrodipicolinate synthase family protein [Hyphomicrobiales bacterium]|nr:dihydrodipicolinate synthase family protein [Hyphomicrobiales bacterium]
MAKTRTFSGVIAPLITPFGADGAPDADRFIDHADWLLSNGCEALAPFGTTSEANSLGLDERMELLDELVDAGIEPTDLMPGTGTCSLVDTIELTQHAIDLDCAGCLMLPPFYYKAPSEEGLYRYFSEVIDGVGSDELKVYLYHIPPVAQVGFSLPLIGRLVKAFPGVVVGLKDSSGDWANTKAILEAHPDLEIFPGSEAFLLDGLRAGAAGVISATANVNPAAMQAVVAAWQSDAADGLQQKITGVRKVIQARSMIPLVKALVAHYRDDRQWAAVRPPLEELPQSEVVAAIAALEQEHAFTMAFADED